MKNTTIFKIIICLLSVIFLYGSFAFAMHVGYRADLSNAEKIELAREEGNLNPNQVNFLKAQYGVKVINESFNNHHQKHQINQRHMENMHDYRKCNVQIERKETIK